MFLCFKYKYVFGYTTRPRVFAEQASKHRYSLIREVHSMAIRKKRWYDTTCIRCLNHDMIVVDVRLYYHSVFCALSDSLPYFGIYHGIGYWCLESDNVHIMSNPAISRMPGDVMHQYGIQCHFGLIIDPWWVMWQTGDASDQRNKRYLTIVPEVV